MRRAALLLAGSCLVGTVVGVTVRRLPLTPGLPVMVVMEEIERCGGSQFDPELSKAFVELCQDLKLHEAEIDDLTVVR